MNDDCVRVTTFVAVEPDDAFKIFTEETDLWWRQEPRFRSLAGGSLRFEDRRRLVETGPDGTQREIGRVMVWDPGKRLQFEWRAPSFTPDERTQVEVRFEQTPGGTRLVLEHRGFAALRKDHPLRQALEGEAFVSMMGLWWGDLATSYRQRAARPAAR